MSAAAMLQILVVAVCKIGNICCLPAPAHQSFSFKSLDLNAPEEAYSRNVRASGTLKFGYEGILKILSILDKIRPFFRLKHFNQKGH